jgi:hypothetical protein
MSDVNEDQTKTLDGKLRFVERAVTDTVSASACYGCAVEKVPHEGLPCSPGTRKDGKHGIWITTGGA